MNANGNLVAQAHNIFFESMLQIHTYECERKERFVAKPISCCPRRGIDGLHHHRNNWRLRHGLGGNYNSLYSTGRVHLKLKELKNET